MADSDSLVDIKLRIENIRKSDEEIQIVNLLKRSYSHTINSNRRLERIVQIVELVNIIEKRCVEKDLNDLYKQIKTLNINPKNNAADPIPIDNRQQNFDCDKKINIIRFLADNLGINYWTKFARELDIKEGAINELTRKYQAVLENDKKLPRQLIEDVLMMFESELVYAHGYNSKILSAIGKLRSELHEKLLAIILM